MQEQQISWTIWTRNIVMQISTVGPGKPLKHAGKQPSKTDVRHHWFKPPIQPFYFYFPVLRDADCITFVCYFLVTPHLVHRPTNSVCVVKWVRTTWVCLLMRSWASFCRDGGKKVFPSNTITRTVLQKSDTSASDKRKTVHPTITVVA